ncbi:type IV secretion system protein VirB10 [Variovorax fucosicus]|uniref:type IV secretion system protein VirB10 n=1 Tax=Variovorax fucosicus TaxID=3053517 RepID=UPI0025786229|nr:type IV secretion system protein VirB10 [Variovorax sp. J22G47]MDM0058967.1 type IV secretion system protein VirB10 [Variovorax sp. J22G47]
MTWQDRFRRSSGSTPPPNNGAEDIDRETGEILSRREGATRPDDDPSPDAGATTVQGERAIPSVNRERSIQSRISSSLALGTIVLLGAGFLFWYYNTQYSKTHEAEEAARKAAAARAAGEMKVPPLGRIDPPKPPPNATNVATNSTLPPPPPASTPNANAGPPQKTPEQLALERQLGMPVLRRAQTTQPTVASSLYGASAAAQPTAGGIPSMSQILGSLQLPGAGPSTGPSSASGATLAANLRPTPTPAVSAQMLPTRRMLLPKGAFIDCTLETAIDSTYEGMTTCIGASDIYGADGKVVLLERGTKYVGEQRGEPRQGQGRVFVVWNEARTPTGVVVQLASPGTDELGRNGLPGFVDTHFWQRFGAAILVSVIDGTMQAIAASQQSGTNVGSGGGVVLGPQSGRDVVTEVLRSTVNIPPTVIKNQGERIQILVARDVDFRTVYALRNDPATP